MATPFYSFSGTLTNLFQENFIARFLSEGLDSNLAYRRHATEETISGRIGSTIIIPRIGRKAPVTQPLAANGSYNLDNGMSPSLPPAEVYQYILQQWGDTEDVDLLGATAAAADLVLAASRTNGVQAAQSLERLAKIQLHSAYEGGNTWVRGDLGAPTTTQVYVDDIRGFQNAPVNGQLQPVSSGNQLLCYEYKTSAGGVTQAFYVTAAVASSPNESLYPGSSLDQYGNVISDGISGYLTITGAAVAPVSGDAIIAWNAAKVVRPLNKPSYNVLTSGDAANLGLLLNAKARLDANNVPPFPDGTYHFLHDPFVMRQLLADQQFMTAYQGRFKSPEYQAGQIFELFGITFIPTTECYIQPPTPQLGINVPIRRSILIGAESLLQANYDGLDTYAQEEGMDPIGMSMIVNNVAQIIRPPLDRQGRFLSLTWLFVGAFACPTDQTATNIIIPTANNALYKRSVVVQTAG
jgi:hypothetical protein